MNKYYVRQMHANDVTKDEFQVISSSPMPTLEYDDISQAVTFLKKHHIIEIFSVDTNEKAYLILKEDN